MNYRMLIILLIPFLMAATPAQLNDVMQQAKQFGVQQNTTIDSVSKATDPSTIPGYVPNPSQTSFYGGTGGAIEDAAVQEAQTNQTAVDIRSAVNSRPPMVIDPQTDPIFMRYDAVRDLSHSVTDNGYQGCVDLPVGTEDVTTITNTTCTATRQIIEETCSNRLTVEVVTHPSCAVGSVIATVVAPNYHWRAGSRDDITIQAICTGNSATATFHVFKANKTGINTCGTVDPYYEILVPGANKIAPALRDDITFTLPMTNDTSRAQINYLNIYYRRRGSADWSWCDRLNLFHDSTSCNATGCRFVFSGQGYVRPPSTYGFGFSAIGITSPTYRNIFDAVIDHWDDQCQAIRERP